MSKREINIITGEETVDENFVSDNYKGPNEDKLADIARLQSEITSERLADAVLGTDNGWLAAKRAEIEAKKDTLI